jgi:hypothetical protein
MHEQNPKTTTHHHPGDRVTRAGVYAAWSSNGPIGGRVRLRVGETFPSRPHVIFYVWLHTTLKVESATAGRPGERVDHAGTYAALDRNGNIVWRPVFRVGDTFPSRPHVIVYFWLHAAKLDANP